MKKELLRINRLNYNYTRTRKLENVSFCILEGECIGFLGLSYSGKDLMTSLLRGELTEGDGSGAIYLGGQKVNDWEVLGKEIYYMCPDNYVIEDWTVAEYLCLVDSGWAGSFWRKGALNEEAGECFAELELDFDISSRMRDLFELEKRIVDVVKAYRKGARIIIIEDEFDGVSQTDIIKFGKIIRRLIQRKLGVIVNSNSNFIMSELSDKFIIFDRGHVVKKCAREYIKNEEQLERFLLGENVLPPREKIEERTQMSWKEEDIVYRIRNLKIFQDDVKSLNFVRGAAEGNGKSYTREEAYTDPEMAKEFIERTNVDALAIGFGTAHGIYTEKPVLDLNRIALIKSAKDIPYVMHGGSGLSEEEYRTAIHNGIRKINYYTYLSLAGGRGVMQYLEDKKDKDAIYFEDIAKAGITAMKADVKRAMKIFESDGKI